MLKPGIYERIIDQNLRDELMRIPSERKAVAPVDSAEAADVLSRYVAEVAKRAFSEIGEQDGIADQVALANRLIRSMSEDEGAAVSDPAEQLFTLLSEKDPRIAVGKTARDVARPETSLAQSSLFTGAKHEPAMYTELKKEIESSDRIDMLVSFIRFSGLRLILDELSEFTQRGGRLRVITTSYMGATEVKAVDELAKLPNTEIRVSYDTERTRLHAKTYLFARDTGFTTAYIGSSNLSHAAISSGMEWNVKVTAKDQPSIIRKVMATFDTYWNSDEFEVYGAVDHDRLVEALRAEKQHGKGMQISYLFDVRPYPYQQEILDRLRAEREVRGHYRNLVVAATGTGKTVISALDYRGFAKSHDSSKLLFIAHREEILEQSLMTFRAVLKDADFGELWVGSHHAERTEHLFISVQTLNSKRLWEHLSPDYYDYIVVDETHHAAADSYDKALQYFKPRILLGLTATPERMDGKSILDYFDNTIAAEIRLPEAINRKLLCPFQYFGVSDTVDLTELRWVRGHYDTNELSNLYSMNTLVACRRADHILKQLDRYTADMDKLKALGFCVSVEHARFMAQRFNAANVPSISLDGNSDEATRQSAKERLVKGEIKVIFVVDLYNEGVDIPEVNTVLFLRPTESLTIFLQQLGRGLRLAEGKDCLTVLDFIGAANRKYNFERKFAALLDDDRIPVEKEIKRDFVSVPKGCYIHLQKKAQKVVLDNIAASYGARRGLIVKIASFAEDSGLELTLANFLNWHNLDIRSVHKHGTFARLCAEAGVAEDFSESAEAAVTKALVNLDNIDSGRWIAFLKKTFESLESLDMTALSESERLMLSMFHATVWNTAITDFKDETVRRHFRELAASPNMLSELKAMLDWLYGRIDFIDQGNALPYACPLDTYCTYTQRQLLSALGYSSFGAMRQGVLYLSDKKTDIFLITLNKSDKDYSPTTMYNDYAVNRSLFHFQSQSTTSADSPTGRRYIHHAETDNRILLFVREFKQNSYGTCPYTFFGEATYQSHQGSRPMNIRWKLKHEIPAKYLRRVQQMLG